MFQQPQETEESTNIQEHETQQEKGKEQAEHVVPAAHTVTTGDQVRKDPLTEQEVTEMTAAQKIKKVHLE